MLLSCFGGTCLGGHLGTTAAVKILSAKKSSEATWYWRSILHCLCSWGSLLKQGIGGWDSWLLPSGTAIDFWCLLCENYFLETQCPPAYNFIMKSRWDLLFCGNGFSFPTAPFPFQVFKFFVIMKGSTRYWRIKPHLPPDIPFQSFLKYMEIQSCKMLHEWWKWKSRKSSYLWNYQRTVSVLDKMQRKGNRKMLKLKTKLMWLLNSW